MSKKIKKAKQLQREHIQSRLLEPQISHAQYQMMQGNFAEAISTCEPLLGFLPKHSPQRVDVLALLASAHGMSEHYEKSYDLFTEAVVLAPTNAELWYNQGLACEFTTRFAEATHSYERAAKLLGTASSELARKVADAREINRKQIEIALEMYEGKLSLAQYTELEKCFMYGMKMSRQQKWKEAEQAFRRIIEIGGRLPQYWGNLGVNLVMQQRFDEAEEALKHALEIDPSYTFALENLVKLPEIRRAGEALGMNVKDVSHEEHITPTITFYKQGADNEVIPHTTIEKSKDKIKSTRVQVGKQPPSHRFFLNPHKDERFMYCPRCGHKTKTRKFCLVIHIHPAHSMLLDKISRYCYSCDLIIVHRDQLEERLTAFFKNYKPGVIGNKYLVMGTLNRAELQHDTQNGLPVPEMLEHLHDFAEVLSFESRSV